MFFDHSALCLKEEEGEGGERSPGSEDLNELGIGAEDCEVIPNDKSTEFILATVTEEPG